MPTALPTPLRTEPTTVNKLGAEFLGTFWLTFAGTGSAVLAAKFLTDDKTQLGIGFVGVALAFGLTVLTMAYAVGHVSGGHFNPAVTVGLAVAKRFAWKEVGGYLAAQIVGAVVASGLLWVIASSGKGWAAPTGDTAGEFATNGYGALSPGGYSLLSAFLIEMVLTAVFLYVIIGSTYARAPRGFAPLAIGLALTLIHLVSIPVTNTSVNPARSIGPALFAGGQHIPQLWLFIVAPLLGAAIAGLTYSVLIGPDAAGD